VLGMGWVLLLGGRTSPGPAAASFATVSSGRFLRVSPV